MKRVPGAVVWLLVVAHHQSLAAEARHTTGRQERWKAFQQAVARDDRDKVADMTFFPFSHPSLSVSKTGKLSRSQFLAAFDGIFTSGIRKQIALGSPRPVTAREIQEAKDEDLDPCGGPGDFVVWLPADVQIDDEKDDESFLHPVFRRVHGRYVFHRVIGCD